MILRILAVGLVALALVMGVSPAMAGDGGERFTSFLGLRLNIGTLNEVAARLGRTGLIEAGDSDEYEARMCYLGSNGVLSFISSSPRLELSGFELREAVTGTAQGCRELHGRYAAEAEQIGGLRLGMSKAQFAALVGDPVRWDGDEGQRLYEGEQKISADERGLFKDSPELLTRGAFNVTVTVTGTFVQDRLVALRVWKVVSA